MKIHFVGFEWKPPKGLPLAEMFKVLSSLHGKVLDFEKQPRLLFTYRSRGHVGGLLLSVRDDTRYNLLDQATLTVEVKDLEKDRRFFDFNAFFVNATTGRGLYAYSFRSMTIHQFFRFCGKHFDERKRDRRQAADAAGTHTPAQLNAEFEDSFEAKVIVRPGTLEKLIDKLRAVNRFEFRTTTDDEKEKWFGVMKPFAKTVTHVISFDPKAAREGVIGAIRETLRTLDLTKATVRGKNLEGFDDVLHLTNNPDPFGVWDLPGGPTKETVKTDDLGKSELMQKLAEIAAQHPTHFGNPHS